MRTLLLVSAAMLLSGCGSNPDFPVAPTRGSVTIDGQPLTGCRVMFAPVAAGDTTKAGRPGFGDIGEDGTFVVSTYQEGDGAVVGEHWVTVINNQPKSPAGKQFGVAKITAPKRQSIVSDQDNEITLEFTRAQLKKFGRSLD